MSVLDKITKITKQFYPTGRAFKMPIIGYLDSLHKVLNEFEAQAYEDALAILDSVLPDNTNFTAEDATDWERRLGLITNSSVPLEDRKLAILRKMNHPGTIPARQNYRYLQGQLQAAGFDVYVYENRFPNGMGGYVTTNPGILGYGAGLDQVQLGDEQLGFPTQLGSSFSNIIANHIDEQLDFQFDLGNNLRSTFFIGGSSLGAFANVSEERKNEFRQLILKIKPVQTVGFLFINYN